MTKHVPPEPESTAPLDQVDPIVRRLVPALRSMVAHEVEKITPTAPRVVVREPDRDIMQACRRVAEAADRLEQAKYTSAEIPARHALERAAKSLQRAMQKHGRLGC